MAIYCDQCNAKWDGYLEPIGKPHCGCGGFWRSDDPTQSQKFEGYLKKTIGTLLAEISEHKASLAVSKGKEKEYWEIICKTGEALGLLVPEKCPYLDKWARDKVTKDRTRFADLEKTLESYAATVDTLLVERDGHREIAAKLKDEVIVLKDANQRQAEAIRDQIDHPLYTEIDKLRVIIKQKDQEISAIESRFKEVEREVKAKTDAIKLSEARLAKAQERIEALGQIVSKLKSGEETAPGGDTQILLNRISFLEKGNDRAQGVISKAHKILTLSMKTLDMAPNPSLPLSTRLQNYTAHAQQVHKDLTYQPKAKEALLEIYL